MNTHNILINNQSPIGWVDNEIPPHHIIGSNKSINENTNGISNDNIEIDNQSHSILAVFYQDLKIGVAYYDRLESNIYLCQCWEDENFSCLNSIKQLINPKVIIIPSRMPQKFIDNILRNLDDSNENNEKQTSKNTQYHYSRFSDFTFESSKNRLLNLKLSMCNTNNTTIKYTFLQNVFNFDNIEMIRAVGGLLSYLSKYILLDDFDSLDNLIINEICPITLNQYLLLDNNTLFSLQIFSNQNHPSCYSFGNSKEGLSLFGLFDKTKTTMGKKLLKTWFMRPSRNRFVIEERQNLIQFFSSQENSSLKFELLDNLKNIKDLKIILSRISSSQNPSKDFISIYKTFHYFLKIKLLIVPKNSELPFLKKLNNLYPQSLVNIYQKFESIFFFADQDDQRISIREGVDEELDQLRNVYLSMDEILTEHGELERVKFTNLTWITSFHLVYYPQLGCLICIPIEESIAIGNQINIPSLSFIFKTSSYLYFQNQKTKELDDFFGDIHNDILDIQSRIEKEVVDEIMSNSGSIIDLCNYCTQLDCILSLASCVQAYDLVKPIISTEQQEIEIQSGRHLIQEYCVTNFIPNDTQNDPTKPVVIVSGPNQSGKSIYIKQVALIVFLGQIGSYVPAKSATISLFDHIYTRISSRESNAISESSFMIDCKQIAQMTRFATSRSLLIIDEYGKGTNPLDGISLLYGLLVFLLTKSPSTPKTFICTHFYEFFELISNSTDSIFNKVLFNTMEFVIETNNNQNNNNKFLDLQSTNTTTNTKTNNNNIFNTTNKITNTNNKPNEFIPFYKLKEGISSSSFGILCAKIAGVNENVVNRAYEIMDHQKQYKTINCQNFEPISPNQSKIKKYNELLDYFENFDPNKDSFENLFSIINKYD
ncbi:hypothetical protein DDB_G0284747 [Dictyostelium discoideum AX4]|uniref:DNA mismatch repair proteins mutS family domain-containing protein n=1 Tax=Dictyostelium discoideum TaxID=44689 RepID=Q54P75_DICDI|nr:hypothetical protein DDB_G0284747 [Dictyostelium discoideum AX4]EAL65026.1 hypothetical protein DDB_G0284747 [Dictyostelium discoideum AX4]|eukprot:XP_638383.1 hypothetical protein DDB_G0284747 [Dictyostelium discoideum AX4]